METGTDGGAQPQELKKHMQKPLKHASILKDTGRKKEARNDVVLSAPSGRLRTTSEGSASSTDGMLLVAAASASPEQANNSYKCNDVVMMSPAKPSASSIVSSSIFQSHGDGRESRSRFHFPQRTLSQELSVVAGASDVVATEKLLTSGGEGKTQASSSTHAASFARLGSGSAGGCPLLFERASRNWWNPKFDSYILEGQYWTSTLPRTMRRFQFGLLYLFVMTLLLAIYFPSMGTKHWPAFLGMSMSLFCLVVLFLFLTTSQLYSRNCYKISLGLSFLLCSMSLLATTSVRSGPDEMAVRASLGSAAAAADLSPTGLYALYLIITLLLYTAVPLPLYATLLIGVTYSALFELLLCLALPERVDQASTIIVNAALHICVHVIGIHTLITTQARMRDTFMKVGQSLMVKKQLVNEKKMKEKMIHSVMPPKVADWLMKEGHEGQDVEELGSDDDGDVDADTDESGSMMVRKVSSPRSSNQGDIRTIFRPFNMNAMENVSILFADIVGFTKMSSNKSASQLVGLLNDLFGRFDYLCAKCGCEKISTLGDCYYCVSGCPEPKPDHARNCVEMGLSMISAIQDFDEDRHESVNMRVGIHTGTVLCGIVGKRRFKFDVWSNDVTLANKMESSGKPGMVHISEKTYAFLKDEYFVQEGEPFGDLKTYFITGRASSDIVPLDTRSARRTSSTPATFLIPATAANADATNNSATQSMPSLQAAGKASLPTRPQSQSQTDRQKAFSAVTPKSMGSGSGRASLRRLSWRNGKRFMFSLTRSDSQPAHSAGAPPITTSAEPASDTTVTLTSSTPLVTRTTTSVVGVRTNGRGGHCAAGSSNCSDNLSDARGLARLAAPGGDLASASASSATGRTKRKGKRNGQLLSGAHSECSFEEYERYKPIQSRRYSNSDPVLQENCDQAAETNANMKGCREILASVKDRIISEGEFQDESSYPNLAISDIVPVRDDCETMPGSNVAGCSDDDDDDDDDAKDDELGTQTSFGCGDASGSGNGALVATPKKSVPLSAQELTALRQQVDRAMITCVKEDGGQHSYFSRPPLRRFTLCFEDRSVENDYRRSAWKPNRFSRFDFERRTMASATFNAYQEIFVSGLLFAAMAIACFLHYPPNVGWSVFFALSMLFHIVVVLVCVQQLTRATKRRTLLFRVYSWCRGWYPSHILGLVLVALPVVSVLSNFDCNALFKKGERELYMQLVFFGTVHFCNLTALTNWIKSGCASLVGLLVVLMTSPVLCPCEPIPPATTVLNITSEDMPSALASDEDGIITTEELREALSCDHERILFVEGIVCLILLLALVWLLNREFETGYRLSFHCSLLSARDRKKIQNLKNQADWLLHNIIPKHVSDQLKKTRQEYSENHHDVGIIFASLVNFNELYDESYMGGKEYLRVLNELISDFDEILDRPEFRNVEKIKTIGSTFMAASGVNPVIRRENSHPNQHLRELLDFVLELQRSVDEFNQSLIEFNLILRIGYNFGDVTAGVIGTTKLYYDIWGDAVNIASRMDSTGVEGRIQVSEKSALALNEWFDFEKRGPVFVKGKDNMITYLLVGRKGETRKK